MLMLLRNSLALAVPLILLGACATQGPIADPSVTGRSGTVQLRVLLRHDSLPATPISDNFVSALVGTPVEVLTGPELCPAKPVDFFSQRSVASCSLSFVLRHAQHGNADVEFSVTSTFDAETTNEGSPVSVHLELRKPVDDAMTSGPYTIQATYQEPAPRLEKQPHEPPTLQLIQSPLRLF
jgi:hypothetical protein